jgi:hypothetical protein
MNSNEIESNVKRIFENFSKEEFPFDLLLAYGISKTSITRLKKGDFNLSKTNGEILSEICPKIKKATDNQWLLSGRQDSNTLYEMPGFEYLLLLICKSKN